MKSDGDLSIAMKVERDVAAPAERVWALITDLDRTAEVVGSTTALERLDDGSDFEVGTRWSETRVMFGRPSTEVMEVTALQAGHAYTVESEASGAHYTSVMTVEPKGDRSVITMSFEGEATSVITRIVSVLGKLFEGRMRKTLQQDLDDIATEAERDA
jgi:carbon monoxide dehydrogenase subunit G